MSDNTIAELVFKQLQEVPENTRCFDCGTYYLKAHFALSLPYVEQHFYKRYVGSSHPSWTSINNGSFICLNCSGIHRSLGVHYSSVRSLNLDSWSEKQLKMMSCGGNKLLYEYFQGYDLNEESVQMRYRTKAADFYRSRLRCLAEGVPFTDEKPGYDKGREVIVEQSRSAAEIMQNNPPFQNNNQQQEQQQSGWFSNPIMTSLWGYTAKALEKGQQAVTVVGSKVQEKLDGTGITENVSSLLNTATENTKAFGSKIMEKGAETYESAQQMAYMSNITENTKSALGTVGGAVAGLSTSVYTKMKTILVEEDENQDVVRQQSRVNVNNQHRLQEDEEFKNDNQNPYQRNQ